ncbi:MAG TPA: pyrroline-5-carboxylate reductase [Thermoanaerobaculia bacterium]|nr:pyrroline-5-carboxylate reductase [Thermoanaerobaculia bacterium]
MDAQRIAFIGSGVMAEVMINGLLTRQVISPERIWAAGPRQERADELLNKYGVRASTNNVEAVENADIVVLCVKPQTLAKVLKQIRPSIRQEHLVMSIIAGARMATIGSVIGHPAIVRCMPNLPCQIHRGMTIWTATPEVPEPVRENVRSILQTMGKEIYVPDETDVDRATAVNGTGPALIAYFVKSLEDAANFIGESRSLARRSVLETILGTAEMILASDRHVGELIDGVTSPGGTTSRALHVLHQGRFSAVLTDAIDAAYRRTVEMGTKLDEQVREQKDREMTGAHPVFKAAKS